MNRSHLDFLLRRLDSAGYGESRLQMHQNVLSTNPITGKSYRDNIQFFKSINDTIGFMHECAYGFDNLTLFKGESEVILSGHHSVKFVDVDDYAFIYEILISENDFKSSFAAMNFYNPKDKLLKSLSMPIGSLRSLRGINYYPGIEFIAHESIFDKDLPINEIPIVKKVFDNIISLSFARNYNDITTDLKSNGIFSSLTAKFNKSSNYKSQLSFISYVRKSNFINRDNSLFKALGYQKIDYVAAGDVLYSTHYLDTHGNNVRKNQSSIEYVIQSMKGQVIRTELK